MFSGVAITVKGTGTQHAELQKLMATFKKNGLLTKKTPEQLPKYVSNICIITAEDSAAYHDMASIFANTAHPFHVTIIPCTMQGLVAANAISNAIGIADTLNPDIICIARGGGAEQDFACYNDPQLATTIANTSTPIITGIGHQINTTLSCLCANHTVETPTALAQFLCNHAMLPLEACHHALQSIHNNLEQTIQDTQHTLSHHMQTLTHTITTSITQTQTHFATLCAQLTELNPLHKLSNGFAYCETNNTPLKSITQVKKDDTINLTLCDGTMKAKVLDATPYSPNPKKW